MGTNEFTWPNGKQAAMSLSFDDARLTQPDIGFEILDRCGVKATFYVSPQNVAPRLEQWKSAARAGHEIGNHTISHPCSGNFPWARDKALEDYTLGRMERELLDANEAIEKTLGVVPRTFAYPCAQTYVGRGENLKSYVPLVARHFEVGRHAFDEIANDPLYCDLALVTSIMFDQTDWGGARKLLEAARTDGRWLILTGHEIRPEGRQSVRPETLREICEYCRQPDHGVWIDTVANVGEHVRRNRENH